MLNCFENIIGISKQSCDCFDIPFSESTSGIYLDDCLGTGLLKRLFCHKSLCDKSTFERIKSLVDVATLEAANIVCSLLSAHFDTSVGLFKSYRTPLDFELIKSSKKGRYLITKIDICGYKAAKYLINEVVIAPLYDSNGQAVCKTVDIQVLDKYCCKIEGLEPIQISIKKNMPTKYKFAEPIDLPICECEPNTFYIIVDIGDCFIAKDACINHTPKENDCFRCCNYITDDCKPINNNCCDTYNGLSLLMSYTNDNKALLCCLIEDCPAVATAFYDLAKFKAIDKVLTEILSTQGLNYETIASKKHWESEHDFAIEQLQLLLEADAGKPLILLLLNKALSNNPCLPLCKKSTITISSIFKA